MTGFRFLYKNHFHKVTEVIQNLTFQNEPYENERGKNLQCKIKECVFIWIFKFSCPLLFKGPTTKENKPQV